MQLNGTYKHVKNVSRTGATAGMVLKGITRSNHGLRIRILADQPLGNWATIDGPFVILDAGENMHSEALQELVGQPIDAAQLLQVIRRDHPTCVNIVNSRILAGDVRPSGRRPRSQLA